MKRFVALILCLTSGFLLAQDPEKTEPVKPADPPPVPPTIKLLPAKQDPQKLVADGSYLLGLNVGLRLGREFFKDELNREQFVKGLLEAMDGDIKADPATFTKTAEAFFKELEAGRQKAYKVNSEAGAKFLAANAKKKGIVVLPSGLQYKVIKSGADGAKAPTLVSLVSCHYRGTLIDGTEFDNSRKHENQQPVSFPTSGRGLIRGFTEALQLMKVGDKWQLFIPENLAYGQHGAPPKIPPGAALIFVVELLDVKDLPQPKPQPGGGLMPFQPPPQG